MTSGRPLISLYQLALVGVRAKLVEPGYGPTTRFTANGMSRMAGLDSDAYAPYVAQILGGMAPAKTTTELDVARVVYLAVTDGTAKLRYPAGADAEELAAMRLALPGETYLDQMRSAAGPRGRS